MTPYIVTTYRPGKFELPIEAADRYSRVTVIGLEEARAVAVAAIYEHVGFEENLGYKTRPLSTPTWVAEARELPESGGAVELSNGTVIEVERS